MFQCFFEIDPSVRADALKTISHAVDFWTLSWLEFHDRTPFSSGARGARPPIASHSSVSSAISSTPGTQLRRDSSFMQFDDVFGGDGDESPSMRRKDSTPYSPDRDDVSGWASMVRECATYTSEESNSYFDQETTFSNKGIGAIETGVEDVNWAGRLVAREIWGVEEMRVNLENYYCWLLRFSVDCPFLNVRRGCKEILARAEVRMT